MAPLIDRFQFPGTGIFLIMVKNNRLLLLVGFKLCIFLLCIIIVYIFVAYFVCLLSFLNKLLFESNYVVSEIAVALIHFMYAPS